MRLNVGQQTDRDRPPRPRCGKTGAAEMWRDWSKGSFLAELQRFIPDLRGDQLVFGPSGIRAQAVDLDGTLVDDFRFRASDRVIHVVNAPSPAATSSLAIAADVGSRAMSASACSEGRFKGPLRATPGR